jgi:WD40 repeat protein
MNQPYIRLLYWDLKKSNSASALSELFVIRNQSVVVLVMRWNLITHGVLAAGCSNGCVILFNINTKSQKTLAASDRLSVIDLQWDRLSSGYLLVAYQNLISLWDTESLTEIHTFDKQSGITGVCWMDWTAGNFVSANSKNGILKIWNASQRQPLDSVRVASGGIISIAFGIGTKRVICGCVNGSIVVYHMVKMMVEYTSAASHTETIFACTFSPVSADILATASYDGSIKLWNVPDLSLLKTFISTKEKSFIYMCDWSPRGDLIAGTYFIYM